MATNKPYGDNARKGAVRSRSQTHNPRTNRWVKRNTETGRFMNQKIVLALSRIKIKYLGF